MTMICQEKNVSELWDLVALVSSLARRMEFSGRQVQVTLEKTIPMEQGLGWRHSQEQEAGDQERPCMC